MRPFSLLGCLASRRRLSLTPILVAALLVAAGGGVDAIVFDVIFPSPMCLQLHGGTSFTVTGSNWINGPPTYTLPTGTLTCFTTDVSPPDLYQSVCVTPANAGGGGTMAITWADTVHSITSPPLLYYGPQILSMYPTSLSIGGGTLVTILGGCFNIIATSTVASVTIQGMSPVTIPMMMLAQSNDTQLVFTAPATGGNDPLSNLNVSLVWPVSLSPAIWTTSELAGVANYVTPLVTNISPSTLSMCGSVVTITGTNFGTSTSWWVYFSIVGVSPALYSTSSNWLSTADDAIVLITPGCGYDYPAGTLEFHLGWGATSYTWCPVQVTYAEPVVTNISPSTLAMPGSVVTITGTNFGMRTSWWTYFSIDGIASALYSTSSDWISTSDNEIVLITPSCGVDLPAGSLEFHLGWGAAAYTWCPVQVTYAPPYINDVGWIFTNGDLSASNDAGMWLVLWGYNFGRSDQTPATTFWTYVAWGTISSSTFVTIGPSPPDFPGLTPMTFFYPVNCYYYEAPVYLHWGTTSYVTGPEFSILCGA
jgi:hypothetical protein